MMRRLLDRMGLSGYMPGSSDLGLDSRDTDAPDAPMGEARITFLGGANTPYSPEEAAQQALGEDIAGDIVWPGKPTTIGLRNEEPLAYRYNLTITNLPANYYVLMPPSGGERQPEGGTLLQPGEEAVFEVRFPPLAREQTPPQSFHFVVTRFDPRRRNDPGVVVGEDAARWVPLPSANDFTLRANIGELRLRPWRRNAKFVLSLQDRSFLPSAAHLHILRAPTRQALEEHAEQVDTISQPLKARQSGTWRCELPPSRLRTSCWVAVRGAIRAGEHQTVPVALPKPIYVRYVPWLRMGRDWAFVGTTVLAMFLLIWSLQGRPVYKSPTVRLAIDFPQGLPNEGTAQDLTLTLFPGSDREKHLEGEPVGGNEYEFHLPGHWYRQQKPFGWSWWGREDLRFTVAANVKDKDKEPAYTRIYRLGQEKLKAEDGGEEFRIVSSNSGAWHNGVIERKARVRLQKQKPEARVLAFIPSEIQSGESFTIRGKGFGKEPGKVFFNGMPLLPGAIRNWTDDSIEVKTPAGVQTGMVPVQLQLLDNDARQDAGALSIAKTPELRPVAVPPTTPPAEPRQPALTGPNTSHPTTPPARSNNASKKDASKEEANKAGAQAQERKVAGSSSKEQGGTMAPPGNPLPTVPFQPLPLPVPTPGTTSVMPKTGRSSAVSASSTEVIIEPGTPNVIVPSTVRTLALQGENTGRHIEAYLEGPDTKTKLRVRTGKAGALEIEMPRKAAMGLHTLELTGEKHTLISDHTLYCVPNDWQSDYTESSKGAERNEKQIALLQRQGDAAFQTYLKNSKKFYWNQAYSALRNAEKQYMSILQVQHTSLDTVEAHCKLARIAIEMSSLPAMVTPADPANQCLERARKEAWMAALEDSRAPTTHTDEVCQLIKNLE